MLLLLLLSEQAEVEGDGDFFLLLELIIALLLDNKQFEFEKLPRAAADATSSG